PIQEAGKSNVHRIGMFGDGTLGIYERKNLDESIRRVPYTGTKTICLQFRSFLEKDLCERMPPSIVFLQKIIFVHAFGPSRSKGIRTIIHFLGQAI
ncbi:MAG: hypothetical protein WA323_25610, partial [Candidatus Nitrosopolaris sp.]